MIHPLAMLLNTLIISPLKVYKNSSFFLILNRGSNQPLNNLFYFLAHFLSRALQLVCKWLSAIIQKQLPLHSS
ncbi:hypothetical protein NEOC95_001396 [Neochlamydia sp. AcF95]|nr:hypothetical protein [Neochlamydia sp. AcF95]